uniref:C-type LECtin n=1 Tax=Caenorhabditis tropicalis TaxID=1561998 RepID=A0A1I7TNR8_9PELO
MSLDAFLLFFLLPVLINSQCNSGAIYDLGRNRCYQYYTAAVDFRSAESVCQSSNGHLLSVHNLIDNNYFAQQSKNNTLNGFVWLGAQASSHDLTNASSWKWTDHSSFDFQNYQAGQPADLASTACMMFSSSTGKWFTANCISPNPFICSYDTVIVVPATSAPQGVKNHCPSRYYWLSATDSCYHVIISPMDYTQANQDCVNRGDQLASVHSDYENDFLVSISTTGFGNQGANTDTHIYIGLIYNTNWGEWEWTDGSWVDYTSWAKGEPNNMKVEFWTALMPDKNNNNYNPYGDEWNNIKNIQQRGCICKRPANK